MYYEITTTVGCGAFSTKPEGSEDSFSTIYWRQDTNIKNT